MRGCTFSDTVKHVSLLLKQIPKNKALSRLLQIRNPEASGP